MIYKLCLDCGSLKPRVTAPLCGHDTSPYDFDSTRSEEVIEAIQDISEAGKLPPEQALKLIYDVTTADDSVQASAPECAVCGREPASVCVECSGPPVLRDAAEPRHWNTRQLLIVAVSVFSLVALVAIDELSKTGIKEENQTIRQCIQSGGTWSTPNCIAPQGEKTR